MGGAQQRREILIIGLALLLAGVVAIALMFVRPPSPDAYLQTTPQPIATPAPATTAAPQPTTAAAGGTAPMLPIPTIQLPSIGPHLWPQLLFGAAAIGMVLTIRQWRRRGATLKMWQIRLSRLALPTFQTPRLTLPTRTAPAAASLPGPLAPPPVAPRSDDLETPPPAWLIDPIELIEAAEESASAISAPAEPTLAIEPIEVQVLAEAAQAEQAIAEATSGRGAIEDNAPSSLEISADQEPEPPAVQDLLAVQTVDLPAAQSELVQQTLQADKPIASSAEDRVLATAAALAVIWDSEGISSMVRGFDTNKADGAHAVLVDVDIHPQDESAILNLPQLLNAQQPSWQASWRHNALRIEIPADGPPPVGGPLIVPILDHGRGLKMTRFFPLATWRHLGIYGSNALHILHALLSSMLYTRPPSHLALAILDRGEITPLYRDVPHLATPPGDTHATLEAIAGALRRSGARATRPLALVMVEPESAALARLLALLMRLRHQHTAPIHLIIAQTQLHSAGREVYALLPALITAGGQGSCSWLPGQGDWPKSGAGRLAGRGMRVEGRPHLMDESTLAATLGHLQRRVLGELPPVIWESPPAAHQAGGERSGGEPGNPNPSDTRPPTPAAP